MAAGATAAKLYALPDDEFKVSTDGRGALWTRPAATGLPSARLQALAVDPLDAQTAFLGTEVAL